MIAPRAISVQSEAIISTLAIIPTPNVAAKKPSALTIIDGIDVQEAEIEEIELDLSKLKVEIQQFKSPFTGKEQKYYFFNYNGEDIYIEDYDSTPETFVEKIVEKLRQG